MMIYADYNATTILCKEVEEYLIERIKNGPYANPNSLHRLGQRVMMSIEKCRRICADVMGAEPKQIIFNSGSSEGISHAFHSLLDGSLQRGKKVILSSGIEHSAVVQAGKFYAQRGFEFLQVGVNESGVVQLDEIEKILEKRSDEIAFVCIMAANNETGVVQPFVEIAKLCKNFNIPFFSDTTQFIGKADFNFQESNLDFAVCSGHKVGALIGSGFLIAKNPQKLIPHVFGGGQEFGVRGGTQNYIGIETLGIAMQVFKKEMSQLKTLAIHRENFEKELKQRFPQVKIIGENAKRLAGTSLVGFKGLHGQAIQIELEARDIFVTTSSACSDNEPATSKVLKAMHIDESIGRSVVRISFGLHNFEEGFPKILEALTSTYNKLNKLASN